MPVHDPLEALLAWLRGQQTRPQLDWAEALALVLERLPDRKRPKVFRCLVCGRQLITLPSRGKTRRTCSGACRQRAYRLRKEVT